MSEGHQATTLHTLYATIVSLIGRPVVDMFPVQLNLPNHPRHSHLFVDRGGGAKGGPKGARISDAVRCHVVSEGV